MNVNLENRIKEKDFAEKFVSFKTIDEVREFVQSEGLDLSDEELKQAGNEINAAITQITPEELELIAGGRRHRRGGKSSTKSHGKLEGNSVPNPADAPKGLAGSDTTNHAKGGLSLGGMFLWGGGAAAVVLACYAIYDNWDKIKAWWKS